MRRDAKDKHWQDVKKEVLKRDKNCRLCKVLSAREGLILKENAGIRISMCDPAHFLPVSTHPELLYDVNNIYIINRYSHDNLDNCRCPLTGKPITKEERDNWWKRIIGEETYTNLKEGEQNG